MGRGRRRTPLAAAAAAAESAGGRRSTAASRRGGGGVRVGKVARGLVGTMECGVRRGGEAWLWLWLWLWPGLVRDVCVSGGAEAEEGSSWMGRDRLSPEQYGPQTSQPSWVRQQEVCTLLGQAVSGSDVNQKDC